MALSTLKFMESLRCDNASALTSREAAGVAHRIWATMADSLWGGRSVGNDSCRAPGKVCVGTFGSSLFFRKLHPHVQLGTLLRSGQGSFGCLPQSTSILWCSVDFKKQPPKIDGKFVSARVACACVSLLFPWALFFATTDRTRRVSLPPPVHRHPRGFSRL